jgi:hypothetical protein
VVVRAGLLLRSDDGGVTVRTAPLPALVGGVPVSIRSLTLRLDRPGFTVNPSGCMPKVVRAKLTGAAGGSATASAPYQATDCAGLAFKPSLRASIEALGTASHPRNPAFSTVITVPRGNAATLRTTVLLPNRLGIDAGNIGAVCTIAQAAADACPANTAIGSVVASTPLLPVPLSGPVYMAAVPGALLPGLRLALGGPVNLRLGGSLAFTREGVETVFDKIPDVPLERLTLTFTAGGPLRVIGDPCTGKLLRMRGDLTGHNGTAARAPARVTVRHCPVLGTARVGHGALRLDLHKGRDTRAMRRLKVRLPRGLRVTGRLRAVADRKLVVVRRSGRTVTLRLSGARDVTLRGAVRGRARGSFAVTGTRVNGRHLAVRLRAARLR